MFGQPDREMEDGRRLDQGATNDRSMTIRSKGKGKGEEKGEVESCVCIEVKYPMIERERSQTWTNKHNATCNTNLQFDGTVKEETR